MITQQAIFSFFLERLKKAVFRDNVSDFIVLFGKTLVKKAAIIIIHPHFESKRKW